MSQRMNPLWWRWLVVAIDGVMVFSLTLIFAPGLMQSLFNPLFFPGVDTAALFSAEAMRYINFTFGLMGAVMIGWMGALLYIVLGAFRRGERWAWYAITVSMVVWYVVDSALSVYAGFGANAISNTVFLVLFAIPLAATYGNFHQRAATLTVSVQKGV